MQLSTDAGSDNLSKSLLRFKEAMAFDLQAWIDCAVRELKGVKLPPDAIILRSLRSEEINIDDSPNTSLDQLGKAIAAALRLNWMPGLIMKSKRTRPLKSLSAEERWMELKSVYQLSWDHLDFFNGHFLLIDDITTTGTTIISIIRLIKEHFPYSNLTVFTLAKSAYDPLLNSSLKLAGTAYTWEENAGWRAAEEEADYNSYEQLTHCILSDDFSKN